MTYRKTIIQLSQQFVAMKKLFNGSLCLTAAKVIPATP